jgi:hypothetical protein
MWKTGSEFVVDVEEGEVVTRLAERIEIIE